MGPFDKFRKSLRTHVDPVFGELTYDHGAWSGVLEDGPMGQEVSVSIVTDGAVPSPGDATAYRDLLKRWSSLEPGIAEALYSLWAPHLAERPPAEPGVVASVNTILRHTTLDLVQIGPGPEIVLSYGFLEEVGWDDAILSVVVTGGHVAPRRLDD